jgi:hypothetical protein
MVHKQIPLPMPRHRTICHFAWPLVDTDQVLNGPRRRPHLARTTKAVPTVENRTNSRLNAPRGQHIEIGRDGFVQDAHRRLVRIPLRHPTCNLFGGLALGEQGEDRGAQAGLDREHSGLPQWWAQRWARW